MKTCFAVSLLLLSLLFSHQTQGIRLDKGSFMSVGHKTIKDLMRTSNGDDEVIVCKDGDECNTAAGITRKLITINTSTSTTISEKNEHKKANGKGFGGKEEALHANTSSSSSSEYPPEIVDIAEMDYSPARRKPPIHN